MHFILNRKGGDSMTLTINRKRVLAFAASLFLLAMMALPYAVSAQTSSDPFGLKFGEQTGLGQRDPRETVASVIQIIMGFLGTVAIIIVLWGGFKWMLSGGSPDKAEAARKLITAGIIGLIIVLSAYAIANFVITQLITATGAR